MWLSLAVTLLPPILIGSLIARTFLPASRPPVAAWILTFSLGAGLGVGLLSLLFFLLRLSFGPSNTAYGIAEALAIAGSAAAYWFFRGPELSGTEGRKFFGWDWLLLGAASIALVIAVALFVDSSSATPYGNWDAWSIWNLRAKLMAQSNENWKNAFSPLLNQLAGGGATHGDYPLLLSAYLARCWSLTGSTGDVIAPIAVSALFPLATVGLLVGGLAALRGWTTALTGGLILLGTAEFLHNGAWQLADVPLGFFYLAVLLSFFLFDSSEGDGKLAIAAGLAMGCAAWTKDEGILYAVLAILAWTTWLALSRPKGWLRTLGLMAAGAIVPLAVTAYFKIFLAPKGIWAPLTISSSAQKIVQAPRYMQIFAALWSEVMALGTSIANPLVCLAVLAACLGVPRERLRKPSVLAALSLFFAISAAYFFTYLVTPLDLTWHLSTSAGRLMVQLLPGTIFLVLAISRGAEETALPIPDSKKVVRLGKKAARPVHAKLGR